jgi:hypothetical protein
MGSQEPGNYFSVDSTTGRLRGQADIPVDVYSMNITVRERNSGKTVQSQITVLVKNVSATAVQQAVALRFPLRNSAIFIDNLYMKLMTALSEIFRVSTENVYVFSVAQSSEGVANSPYGVDVWVAVKNSNGDFMNANYVFTKLEENYMRLVSLGKFLFPFRTSPISRKWSWGRGWQSDRKISAERRTFFKTMRLLVDVVICYLHWPHIIDAKL